MPIFSFSSTLVQDDNSHPILVSVHHQFHKKLTQRHLNQDHCLGSIRILSIRQSDEWVAFTSLPVDEQIRLRHESWNYILQNQPASADSF
ncbi:MAG: hypothetical protein LEGION0403_FIIPPAGN_02065 [Legionella sp.]|uniref:hypothetical protein n=1 Tax=Legionella sp. TaxID=459 RepID=UPI003D1478E2